jgi:hypothetical protein
MNAATYDHLRLFANAARVLRHIVPELPPVPVIEPHAGPWQEIDAAARWMDGPGITAGRYEAGPDAPLAWCHWHRIAGRSIVLAAAEAAGQGLAADELLRLDRMTTAELADELTYMADYQG